MIARYLQEKPFRSVLHPSVNSEHNLFQALVFSTAL
jgi:hypothetical protein